MSAEKEIPSTGAVPKAKEKSERFSRNKHRDMESESGPRVQNSLPMDPDVAESSTGESKSKKRHKSVSFFLDGGEGTSQQFEDKEFLPKIYESRVFRNSRMKKHKKNRGSKDQAEEEMEPSTSQGSGPKHPRLEPPAKATVEEEQMETAEEVNDEGNNIRIPDTDKTDPLKKLKKRKRSKKCARTDCDDEPISKIRKNSYSDDELLCELENLHIGPEALIPGDLFSTMVPDEPNLKKETECEAPPVDTDVNDNISNKFDLQKVVKWTKKRWNKDKKGASTISAVNSSVIIQNLPVAISSVYHLRLLELFEKFGRVKRIGIPEMTPGSDDSVFSVTIFFETEEAAAKALAHNYGRFCGSVIRVCRPPHPVATTAVARCFSQPTTDELRAIFSEAGPLSNIRVEKRRGNGMALAFLEFDGPESVQRAVALSGTARVKGKPIFVKRFEIRPGNKQMKKA